MRVPVVTSSEARGVLELPETARRQKMKTGQKLVLALVIALLIVPAALADAGVYVGYADGIRANGFFPNPWQGTPGVQFFNGASGSGSYDAGAIRITNSGSSAIVVNGISVYLPTFGSSFNLWGTVNQTLNAGQTSIFTQTADYNFDSSDGTALGGAYVCVARNAFCDANAPTVTVTIDGVTTSYSDYGHVLDTYGFDLANVDNESIGWHLIGTDASNRNNVPEPASLLLFGTGLAGLATSFRRKRRA
jgi:hypothetical protein